VLALGRYEARYYASSSGVAAAVAGRHKPLNADPLGGREGGRLIREYRFSDLEDVLSAWAAASEIAHPFLTPDFLRRERHNIPNLYLPNAETWVWEVDGSVVGFISLIENEVGALFVQPAHHGSGIGRALIDKARALRGDLELEVFERNAVGRAFYDRYGFVLLRKTVHEPTGESVLRLELRE
jgi:putative acetyltransferase